jgi:nucleotide-binding universal stress UspA family protein
MCFHTALLLEEVVTMFEHILVPLDGSNAAEIVFPYVVDFAENFASDIFLVHVAGTASPAINKKAIAYLHGAQLKIKSMLDSWGVQPGKKLETRELTGNPAVEILKYAGNIDAGLIAVASHGESSTGPWPLGNIAAKILRASSYPVLLVRKQAEEARLIQKKLVKKILAPLDGSKLGEAAIPFAVEIANKTGAEIVLFRVVEPVANFAGPTGEIAWNFISTYEKNAQASVINYLERIRQSLSGVRSGLEMATGEGQPASEIIDYAQVNDIDLIAMSTHGRSGIGRWVYGSVTEKVLHSGDQPVLVVQPKTG